MGQIDKRLAELGIILPVPAKPVANYVPGSRPAIWCQLRPGAVKDGKIEYQGKLGKDFDRGCSGGPHSAINVVAQLRDACGGDLDRIKRIVKVVGFVNGVPDIRRSSQGGQRCVRPAGRDIRRQGPARALRRGCGSLPVDLAVEVEAVAEIE